MLIPAAFSATATTANEAEEGILKLSHGTALILLLVYILFLFFQVSLGDRRNMRVDVRQMHAKC
jgi:Ca2+/H+ antiporter